MSPRSSAPKPATAASGQADIEHDAARTGHPGRIDHERHREGNSHYDQGARKRAAQAMSYRRHAATIGPVATKPTAIR